MNAARKTTLLFGLFALSGCSALIYESVWTHYLGLILGHAAFSQALVVSIFMAGMAIGALAAGHIGTGRTRLLFAYALVETGIGIGGLLFHPLFTAASGLSLATIVPLLGSPALARIWMWLLSAILILPQSILLGMTFPLMCNGVMRRVPEAPGRALSILYFANTMGGAFGVLLTGFFLIHWIGLPGTLHCAAIINFVVAAGAAAAATGNIANTPADTGPVWRNGADLLLPAAAAVTGAASFIYEIVWLRMLSMVLGASTRSFELMLCAFLVGLACGGFWIRRRLDSLANPLRAAATIQICMGLLALLTLPLYNFTFDLMALFMAAVPRTPAGYILSSLFGNGIAMLVMLPTTICAGMTLPLFTWMLMKKGYGERSVGHIYAANSAGAIAGVFFAIFLGMPLLAIKGAMITASLLDLALGFTFLAGALAGWNGRRFTAIAAACVLVILATFRYGDPDPRRMASAVFRMGYQGALDSSQVVFHRDGSTSSIALKRIGDVTTLLTNGKPDASLRLDANKPATDDEVTMVLTAAIPLAMHPQAQWVANIGLGSGLTTHTLLDWPGVRGLDTVEIEPAVVTAVKRLGSRVGNVFSDPRSHIYIDDARSFFALRSRSYDIIISEPSNPWVSGIASLFTRQFYRQVQGSLAKGGVFAQWLQLYEIDEPLVLSIMSAFAREFPHYRLFRTDDYNLILVGCSTECRRVPASMLFSSRALRHDLKHVGVMGPAGIANRVIADEHSLAPLLAANPLPANSDYMPVLDQNAERARFLLHHAPALLHPPPLRPDRSGL